jgi:hypothetical protein
MDKKNHSEDFITRIGYLISYVILGMLVVGVLAGIFVKDHYWIELFGQQRWEIVNTWYLRVFFGLFVCTSALENR